MEYPEDNYEEHYPDENYEDYPEDYPEDYEYDEYEDEYEEDYEEGYYEGKLVRALYEYTAENEEQICLQVGDELTVLEEHEDGWWKGELNGKEGLFPANYVELKDEPQENPELTDKEDKRRKAMEDNETLKNQLEEAEQRKAALRIELDQLKMVREHEEAEVYQMRMVRSDVMLLAQDLSKVMIELQEEKERMVELQTARQTLQAELDSFNASIDKEIKKGQLVVLKTDILSKYGQLALKLTDDDKFTGMYEKKRDEFYFILKQLRDNLPKL
eukprot:CAMPEP_0174250884 /NCGR_PEP_ID=MMETSP0439-20130205/904_1 /TAXON_ID=0 /ORGANISM="Stereomyxa ramosa, Strain Chinc5" /LENGTH=271 /DNA_ID=CAMNT_0015331061 /DNA_START=83 /DNA_END=898 /DNA_ORIENTATION=+